MPRLNPKIDLVFKKLFGAEENTDILMSLINAILPLHQQLARIKIKNPYNVSDYAEGKLSILDIKAEDEKGIKYDIEMQIRGTSFYGKRTLYYWAKMFGSQLDYVDEEESSSYEYEDLKKCIVISLMDFRLFDDDIYHRCFMLKNRDTNETHESLDYLDLYFVELKKFKKELSAIKTLLERWITFLNKAMVYEEKTLPRELAEIAEIRKANKRLEILAFDEKERSYYEGQQKFLRDHYSVAREMVEREQKKTEEQRRLRQEAERQAKEAERQAKEAERQAKEAKNALQKDKISTVKKLIELGLDNEAIVNTTGLDIQKIKELRKS